VMIPYSDCLPITAAGCSRNGVWRRRLSSATRTLARRFLALHPLDAGVTVSGAEVVAFLLRESQRVSVGSAKGRVAELRSLLRFLFVGGLTPRLLTTAVPPVARWRDTGICKALPAGHVQQLLDHCDRSDPVQVRDYAILMLVARLGLRSIEVARMQLDDIDWRAGRIALHRKASREDGIPLPQEVGAALTDYLTGVRPRIPLRSVFISCRAPRRAIRANRGAGAVAGWSAAGAGGRVQREAVDRLPPRGRRGALAGRAAVAGEALSGPGEGRLIRVP
jgi:integrase